MSKNTKTINTLTPEQKAYLPVFREEWRARCTTTGPCDRKTIEKEALALYQKCGLKKPKKIYWEPSPLAGARKAKEILDGTSTMETVAGLACHGAFEGYWVAQYTFGAHIGATVDDRIEQLQALCDTGWWWPMDEAIVFTERPDVLLYDEQHRLHCDDGPAVLYQDGFSLYAVHGVIVTEAIVRGTFSVDDVRNEHNAERRRIMAEKMGYEAYIKAIGAKVIHHDELTVRRGGRRTIKRALFEDDLGNKILHAPDGSTPRRYFMPVASRSKTCAQAHFSISGFLDSDCVAQG